MVAFIALSVQAFKTASKDQYMGTHACQQPAAVLRFLLARLFTKNSKKSPAGKGSIQGASTSYRDCVGPDVRQ
jgi:hypothetical protein